MRANLCTAFLLGVCFAAVSRSSALASDGAGSVYVRVPEGLSGGVATVEPASDGEKYVSLEDVVIPNPSRHALQTASPHDFHLLANGTTYYPVVRKGLAAIDLSQSEVVSPGSQLETTVTFLVPESVKRADFEFTPHWFADDGHTVDFCCEYK